MMERSRAGTGGTVPAVATDPSTDPLDERPPTEPSDPTEPSGEHPFVDAAVEALGGTPASVERPPESPVQPVLPRGLRGAVARFDHRADATFAKLRLHPAANRVFYSASALGDFSLVWHLVGTTRALRSPTDERAAVRLVASLLVETVVINGFVKSVFRRQRPTWEQERVHTLRKPRSSSFPSGHATSGFMAATLLVDGRARSAPLWYGVAAVIAASRVHVRIHHGSDVVAGAAIGVGLGTLARRLWPLPRR